MMTAATQTVALGIPAALAVLGFGIVTWQFLAAMRFPLHRRAPGPPAGGSPVPAPGVSVLKPLKGLDPGHSERCLRSWLGQDHNGPLQFLFVVADEDDPVVPLVRRLIAEHPHRDARLLVCPSRVGANAKVSKLAQAEGEIVHGLVLVSDADVLAPPDLVSQMVLPLEDPGVGLVHCFYRLANPSNAAMEWEATAVNADFWSQVLQSRTLAPMDFALGASMLIRRTAPRASGASARWPTTWPTISRSATGSPRPAGASSCARWWSSASTPPPDGARSGPTRCAGTARSVCAGPHPMPQASWPTPPCGTRSPPWWPGGTRR